jgi:hypothetical protein
VKTGTLAITRRSFIDNGAEIVNIKREAAGLMACNAAAK